MKITPRREAAHSGPSRIRTSIARVKRFATLIAGSSHLRVEGKAHGCKEEEEVRNQTEDQNAKMQCTGYGSALALLVAGLGIGAAVSVFLAPKSGVETREWIATKCLDGIDAANVKVRQTRLWVHELVDQGQQKVSAAVIARREALGKAKAEAKPN